MVPPFSCYSSSRKEKHWRLSHQREDGMGVNFHFGVLLEGDCGVLQERELSFGCRCDFKYSGGSTQHANCQQRSVSPSLFSNQTVGKRTSPSSKLMSITSIRTYRKEWRSWDFDHRKLTFERNWCHCVAHPSSESPMIASLAFHFPWYTPRWDVPPLQQPRVLACLWQEIPWIILISTKSTRRPFLKMHTNSTYGPGPKEGGSSIAAQIRSVTSVSVKTEW